MAMRRMHQMGAMAACRGLRRPRTALYAPVLSGFPSTLTPQPCAFSSTSPDAPAGSFRGFDIHDDLQGSEYVQKNTGSAEKDEVDALVKPFRPDNWEELLAEADADYPDRAGPRRNKARERERHRQWTIGQQRWLLKKQKVQAHQRKQGSIKMKLDRMRDAYFTHGFAPAMEYASATNDVDSVGLGGQLGRSYFKPIFESGVFNETPGRPTSEPESAEGGASS